MEKDIKIETIFDKYLEYLKFYRKKGTFIYYKKNFKLLLKALYFLKIYTINDLSENTYDEILKWIKFNTDKKNSKINDTMSSFITALNYSKVKIEFNKSKLTDDTTPFKILNDQELYLLFSYLKSLDLKKSNNLVWVTCVLLALDTGARKNELINIKTEDVDFIRRTIYLQTTKTEKRFVKFGNLSDKYLKKVYDPSKEYLLNNTLKSKPLNKYSIEKFFIKINDNVKLSSGNITLHRLRKTFATKLFLSGMPLPSIQKILGHTDIKMTMRYIDVSTLVLDKHYKEFYPY